MNKPVIYTYVVDHGDKCPRVRANDRINGGEVKIIMFDDALEKLFNFEEFLSELRDSTTCDGTRDSIDDFLN